MAQSAPSDLADAAWAAPEVITRLGAQNPSWRRENGACPACAQQAPLYVLLEKGDAALHDGIQSIWPLDAEAAFGAIPTPLRMHAAPRFTGRGVTIALLDSGFYPHPDLTMLRNRIRAWVDAGQESLDVRCFGPDVAWQAIWPNHVWIGVPAQRVFGRPSPYRRR